MGILGFKCWLDWLVLQIEVMRRRRVACFAWVLRGVWGPFISFGLVLLAHIRSIILNSTDRGRETMERSNIGDWWHIRQKCLKNLALLWENYAPSCLYHAIGMRGHHQAWWQRMMITLRLSALWQGCIQIIEQPSYRRATHVRGAQGVESWLPVGL